MITPTEVHADKQLARRVLISARTIAPCILTLDGDDREDALAILKGVAEEAEARGLRSVTSERTGSASVSWRGSTDWFTDEDKASLRMLCGITGASGPVGSFPKPSRAIRNAFLGEDEE